MEFIMAILLRCQACATKLKVRDELMGKSIKCPSCKARIIVSLAGGNIDVPKAINETASKRPNGVVQNPDEDSDSKTRDDDYARPTRGRARNENTEGYGEEGIARRPDEERSKMAYLIGGIGVGALLVIAGALGMYLFMASPHGHQGATKESVPGAKPTPDVKPDLGNILVAAAQEKVQEAARRTQLLNNLKQLAICFHLFNDIHSRMPAPGFSGDPRNVGTMPLLSWRVAILPLLEEDALYKEFRLEEPWDSPHNIKLLPRIPKVFAPLMPNPPEAHATYFDSAP
ncbi:MAG: DUF1559 domain-containing protein [Planctomycetes bacterium]|nr:DUF1559 domain-containing protein [Planctomycetota bacterium]